MNRLRTSCGVALLSVLGALSLPVRAAAQAAPSAYGPGHSLWAGVEFSNMNASFPYQSGQRIAGVGAFADYHLSYRFGLVGDARFLNFGGYQGTTESSYLAGPKIYFLAPGKFRLYGKFLAGVGRIHYPYEIGSASYLALAPGAGAEYRIKRRWMAQADYEYQMWPGSPGYANEPKHELTPNGFQVGVAYRVF